MFSNNEKNMFLNSVWAIAYPTTFELPCPVEDGDSQTKKKF